MLFRAPVQHVKSGKISRKNSYLAVVMRHYPRYTPKELIDEYIPALAPDLELFREFKETERITGDHNLAFETVKYQERFDLTEEGWAALESVAKIAQTKSVYLICQCNHDLRCHCDLLLIAARARFNAPISQLPFSYPVFAGRV